MKTTFIIALDNEIRAITECLETQLTSLLFMPAKPARRGYLGNPKRYKLGKNRVRRKKK